MKQYFINKKLKPKCCVCPQQAWFVTEYPNQVIKDHCKVHAIAEVLREYKPNTYEYDIRSIRLNQIYTSLIEKNTVHARTNTYAHAGVEVNPNAYNQLRSSNNGLFIKDPSPIQPIHVNSFIDILNTPKNLEQCAEQLLFKHNHDCPLIQAGSDLILVMNHGKMEKLELYLIDKIEQLSAQRIA